MLTKNDTTQVLSGSQYWCCQYTLSNNNFVLQNYGVMQVLTIIINCIFVRFFVPAYQLFMKVRHNSYYFV